MKYVILVFWYQYPFFPFDCSICSESTFVYKTPSNSNARAKTARAGPQGVQGPKGDKGEPDAPGNQTVVYQNVTIYENRTLISEVYQKVKDSIVLIRGTLSSGTVQGSGFVFNYSGNMIVITNNHVVPGSLSLSVTFSDGDGYAAVVKGTDPYSDLAVLTVVGANESEFRPVSIVSSTTLRVGDPAIVIGNPFGLVGSMTTGIISALGRTITEDDAGGFPIANIIQTSTHINPGNSGGPLLNSDGYVVGITTAIVADSQGLGFAIPSTTIEKCPPLWSMAATVGTHIWG